MIGVPDGNGKKKTTLEEKGERWDFFKLELVLRWQTGPQRNRAHIVFSGSGGFKTNPFKSVNPLTLFLLLLHSKLGWHLWLPPGVECDGGEPGWFLRQETRPPLLVSLDYLPMGAFYKPCMKSDYCKEGKDCIERPQWEVEMPAVLALSFWRVAIQIPVTIWCNFMKDSGLSHLAEPSYSLEKDKWVSLL